MNFWMEVLLLQHGGFTVATGKKKKKRKKECRILDDLKYRRNTHACLLAHSCTKFTSFSNQLGLAPVHASLT